jgi:hypothetical protein
MFYTLDQDKLNSDILHILDDWGNTIHISSESVKELLHVFQNGRIRTRRWKAPEDILYYIKDEWSITINYV